jgi:hypothetical protein
LDYHNIWQGKDLEYLKRVSGNPHAGLASRAAANGLALDAKEAKQPGALESSQKVAAGIEETRKQAEPRPAEEARETDVARPHDCRGLKAYLEERDRFDTIGRRDKR